MTANTPVPDGIQVYSTLTRKKEPLVPREGNQLKIFVCGPTVYDHPHIGHAKTYTQFDFIVRYLRWRGYEVDYLQNITDIDDKIILRAAEQGISCEELTRKYEKIYVDDMNALHNTSVNRYARATDYVPEIIQQVQSLVDRGYAYQSSGGVYYEVAKFSGYGKLSGRTDLREEDAVSRIDESREKRGWNDFCLWKAPKPGEPSWDSPFGEGRPGWHIEDTAITETLFGPQYDIHGGAVDLIFPHHEAEISQMEASSGLEPMVQYWLHTGFLNVDSRKMSKSLKNFKTIREALESYDYRVLRYFFLSKHYRSPIDFSEETLKHAQGALHRLDDFVFAVERDYDDTDTAGAVEQLRGKIVEALDDDFAAPRAFAALFDFIRRQNVDGRPGRRTYELLREINSFLDILSFKELSVDAKVEALVEQRQKLRAERKYAEADAIRDELLGMGIELVDTKDGAKVKPRKVGSEPK